MSYRFRFPSWSKHAVILVTAAAALGGCRDVLGVEGYGTYPPCQPCMAKQCADVEAACAAEPACSALEACLAKCHRNDDACRVTCNLSIRRTTEMSKLIECAARSCDQCAVAYPTFGGLECTQCLKREAPESLKALSKSIAALELESCQQDCSPGFEDECLCTDVEDAVSADGGTGGAELLRALRYGTPGCSDDCARADWSCLGNVKSLQLPRWDPARTLTLHVRLAKYLDTLKPMKSDAGVPHRGTLDAAAVTACSAIPDCTDIPPRSGQTEPGTGANLSLHQPMGSGDYFTDLAVQWNEESTIEENTIEKNTALLYFFPPLRRNPSWTWRRVVSRSEADHLVRLIGDQRLLPLNWEKNGGIIWSVAGCNGVPADDVTATLEPLKRVETPDGTDVLVYVDGNYVLSEASTVTSKVGLGAVISALPGARKMVLERSSDGRRIGTYDFQVVAGAITVLSFAPYEP